MSKYLYFILFLSSNFLTLDSWQHERIFRHAVDDDARGIRHTTDKKCIFIPELIFDLDFSKDFSDLEILRFPIQDADGYKKYTTDFGLSNNVHLKELQFINEGFSILRWTLLPSVEVLKLTGATVNTKKGFKTCLPYNLSFLEHSLPYLKTIAIYFPQSPLFETMFEIPFESMSPLHSLENLLIILRFGVLDFTEKDFKAISLLQNLKTLEIRFVSYDPDPSVKKLQSRLQSILPNTKVEVNLKVVPYPDDKD